MAQTRRCPPRPLDHYRMRSAIDRARGLRREQRPQACSLQRCDVQERFATGCTGPILTEFVLVQFGPLDRQPENTWWERSAEDGERKDANARTISSVASMEMRGHIVIVVHGDDDPEKATDLRHPEGSAGAVPSRAHG